MNQKLAEIIRAGAIESEHYGFYAFLQNGEFHDSSEKSIQNNYLETEICLRSVSKLFQTLTCLRLGLEITNQEIAISTSSHSGSDHHVKEVDSFLENHQLNWQNLKCGEHAPLDRNISFAPEKSKERRLQNNCSGKHSMMLATCKVHNWNIDSYLQSIHPLQVAVLETMSELCEIKKDEIKVGVDGCGLPTYALKAKNLLIGFSKFRINSPDRLITRLSQSLIDYAFLVSGENRLDYELSKAYVANLLSKSGYGGLTVVNLQNQALTLLVKLYDSDEKVRALILKNQLKKLGVEINSAHFLFDPKIANLHEKEVAEIKFFD
jgi:L-asparaginase II